MKKSEYRYTAFAKARSRELRKNMTPSERHLWFDFLRSRKPRFLRQRSIGPYIVDFICYESSLIIELDGEVHGNEEARAHDEARTNYLKHQGFRLVRFRSRDVFEHFESVCQEIENALTDPTIEGMMT